MPKVLTTCVYCGCGCNMYLDVSLGRVVGVTPSQSHPISKGMLCIKGFNIHEFIHDERRLKMPLIREGDSFIETSWDKALKTVADKLSSIKDEYGADSIACLASAKCTNEDNYLMQKFARAVIGTSSIDHCARLCHASTVAGLAMAFGSGAMTNSIDEIEGADVIFLIGSNTSEQHPLIAARIIGAVKKGAKLIIADPRRIFLSHIAFMNMHQKPGTDVALLNGIMHEIIKNGFHDRNFIESRTENFEEFKKTVEKYAPEKVEAITGVPASAIKEAAQVYANAENASIIYSMGITQHTTGTDNVLSLANLAMLTGNIGRASTGVNPLRGHQDVQGSCDMGCLPDSYPGYQKVSDEAVREKFEKAWKAKLPESKGLTMIEMFDAAARGEIKALYVMGENPMIADPDCGHIEKALKNLEFLAVQDIFMTDTAMLANVVLPAASFAEKDGTFTNTERNVQLVRKAIEPIGESMPDWMILQQLSKRMGYDMPYRSSAEVLDEAASLAPIYGGISHERLQKARLQWPCPTKEHDGTRILHKEKFTRGLGKFHAVEFRQPDELTDEEYPFTLTTGRLLEQFHTGTMTRKSATLEREEPACYVELNPSDAKSLQIKNGGRIKVSSRRGSINAVAKVTDAVKEKVVFIPFHYREAAANKLTNPALDPIAKIPEYKVCAVKIERI